MKIIAKEMNIIEKLKSIRFAKMHGLGNDFMIIDARKIELNIDSYLVKALSNRNLGVGFDQLAVIYEPISTTADCLLKFWNKWGAFSAKVNMIISKIGVYIYTTFISYYFRISSLNGERIFAFWLMK